MEIEGRFVFPDLPEPLRLPVGLLAKLHKAGVAHIGFSKLQAHQAELRKLCTALMQSKGDYARKLAGTCIGYFDDASLEDFDAILASEIRLADTGDELEGLNAHSTVEDLVFSAVRLIKDDRQADIGRQFLIRIVEDVAEGRRYWNTSNYAIGSLMHVDSDQFLPLFRKWTEWCAREPHFDDVQSIPHIAEGRGGAIFDLLSRQDQAAAELQLDAEAIALLDDLITANSN